VQERWSQLRLVVIRGLDGSLTWTLVHRRVDGKERWDRRLHSGRLPCPPGSPESVDALAALGAALKAAAQGPEAH